LRLLFSWRVVFFTNVLLVLIHLFTIVLFSYIIDIYVYVYSFISCVNVFNCINLNGKLKLRKEEKVDCKLDLD